MLVLYQTSRLLNSTINWYIQAIPLQYYRKSRLNIAINSNNNSSEQKQRADVK